MRRHEGDGEQAALSRLSPKGQHHGDKRDSDGGGSCGGFGEETLRAEGRGERREAGRTAEKTTTAATAEKGTEAEMREG